MKKLIAFALLLIAFPCAAARGQGEGQTRDLFLSYAETGSKGSPGVKIKIELLRDGKRKFVPLNTIFESGDSIKLYFEANFPAYVEIYNLGSSGERQKLFPYTGAATRVKITSSYVVPREATKWFEFDDTPGTERLSFIFSNAEIPPSANSSAKKRPPANSSAKAKKRPASAGGPIRPSGQVSADEAQQELDKFDQRAMEVDEEDSRDLKLVELQNDSYILSTQQRLQRAVKININLRHR